MPLVLINAFSSSSLINRPLRMFHEQTVICTCLFCIVLVCVIVNTGVVIETGSTGSDWPTVSGFGTPDAGPLGCEGSEQARRLSPPLGFGSLLAWTPCLTVFSLWPPVSGLAELFLGLAWWCSALGLGC